MTWKNFLLTAVEQYHVQYIEYYFLHRGEVALRIHKQKYDRQRYWETLNEQTLSQRNFFSDARQLWTYIIAEWSKPIMTH